MAVCLLAGCGRAPTPAGGDPPKTIAELVRTIDDLPRNDDGVYEGKLSETPSVYGLIAAGEPAIPPVLGLMLSDNWPTRLRAQTVLEGITRRVHGFVPGTGWPDRESEGRFRAFWISLGNLNHDAPREDRERAVRLWENWLASRKG